MLAAELRETPFSGSWLVQAVHSPWALGVLGSDALSFFLWLHVLTKIPLSKAFPITAISYIAIELMSWTLFKEPLVPLQIMGGALILAGLWLIGGDARRETP